MGIGSVPHVLCTSDYICATSTSACCRGRAASVFVALFFCRHKPASAFFVQLVWWSFIFIMHKNSLQLRVRLNGLIKPKPGLCCLLHDVFVLVAHTKPLKSIKKHGQAGSAERNGWVLIRNRKNGGGRLPGTWMLTLTRPKTGGGRLPGSGHYLG